MSIISVVKEFAEANLHLHDDLLSRLREDHDQLKELLKTMEESSDQAEVSRKKNVEKLKALLTGHAEAEANVLYKKIAQKKETEDLALEGFEEHGVADFALNNLVKTPVTHKSWKARVTVLRELLEHHIKEEENDMFPKVRDVLSEEELIEMKEEFEDEFERISKRPE